MGNPPPPHLHERRTEPIPRLTAAAHHSPTHAPPDVGADVARCGKAGSPTQVKYIESVVLAATDHKGVEPTPQAIAGLMHELTEDHVLD